jgi:hypothetical protein
MNGTGMRMRDAAIFVLLLAACGTPSTGGGGSGDTPNGAVSAPDPNGSASPAGPTSDGGTSSGGTSSGGSSGSSGSTPVGRDWKTFPAIADVPATPTIYALSDVHGGYDRLTALLLANNLISQAPAKSTDAHWAAGSSTLVVTGDMIDKGPSSVEVLDFLMALQTDAKKAGGVVIVTLGNHEAEFLVDPSNSKASGPAGIDTELTAAGVMPSSLASGADPRGAWLHLLPFGAKVGGWFFSHAGDTQGRTITVLESTLEGAVKAHPNYDDPEIVGTTSILESRAWYSSATTTTQNAAALGVHHIVFGHDPSALGAKGRIAVGPGGVLIRIDCGMSPGVDDSTGMILRISQEGVDDVVAQLDASGTAKPLFTAPR